MSKVKVVMIGERRFHLPFVDLIPFSSEDDAKLGESIAENGILVAVVAWKDKSTKSDIWVSDGAHRILWAEKHGIEKIPISWRNYQSEEEAKEDCEALNYQRRHMTTVELQRLRSERIERIAERRRQGESLRAIADAENVSPEQVRRDVKAAGVTGVTPESENGEIIGKDGKSYKSSEQKPVCERCERVGAVQGCPACQKLAEKAAKKKKRKKKKPARDPLQDAFKNEIPQRCRAAWGDPWIQQTIDFLAEASEQFRKQRIADGMAKREKAYPFYVSKDVADGCGFISSYFDELIEHLKVNRPAGVCPSCSGDGCNKCKGAGMVPREVYKELKK